MDFGSGREFTLEGEEAVSSMPEEEYRSLLNEYMIAPDMTELLCAGYASKNGREIDRFNIVKDMLVDTFSAVVLVITALFPPTSPLVIALGAIGVGSIGASAYAIKGAKAIDGADDLIDLSAELSPEDAKKYLEFLENGSTAGLTPEELAGIDKLDELLALEKEEWDDVVKISGSPTVGKVFTDNPFDEVGKLKPNIKYQTGEYNYIYETDVQGRIINWYKNSKSIKETGIMKPIYAESIVVVIKQDGCTEWYILDKDYCFLDYSKLEEAYRKKGYDVVIDDTPRFGIKVVNELTQTLFLEKIKEYKIATKELKKMLMNESNYNDKLACNPSLLIDFDNKVLISYYAETESFEDFVPDGWKGKYQDFAADIPKNQRYWIDENGRNLIGE